LLEQLYQFVISLVILRLSKVSDTL